MPVRKHGIESDDQSNVSLKRTRLGSSDPSFESDSSEDSDSDWEPQARTRVSSSKRRASKPTIKTPTAVKTSSKASILSLATTADLGRQDAADRLAGLDSAVLGKIKKALALGGHQATGEAEAKRAMRLAAKLMAQHNVDQADILAAEEDSEKLKRAGQSTVTIKSAHSHQGVVMHAWSATAASAMGTFFDCKTYNETFYSPNEFGRRRVKRIDWTFYGLCEQTVTAAFAFEMVYNLVLTWSIQNKKAKGRSGKNVYCHGVADGLCKLARREKKEEERLVLLKEARRLENARVAEEQERKKAVDRLLGINTSDVKKELSEDGQANVKLEREEETIRVKVEEVPDEAISLAERYDPHDNNSSSSDDDNDDFTGDGPSSEMEFEAKPDFKDEGDDQDWMLHDVEDGDIKSGPVNVKKEETPWTSAQQLTLFRNNASTIADEYLKQTNKKLRAARRRFRPKLESKEDIEIYNQGQEDAQNIDVKRKRIRNVNEDLD